ncbi:MAG: hypothetical protein IJD60_07020 [Clostridia bacterium]|nr:hypothetical protein [Clostridia bacterium]
MPLIICTCLFLILFALEGCCYVSSCCRKENELLRYQAVEHPRRPTGDRYLDLLG